ncbi:hypothetical protein ERD78_13595 [Allopusillimonas soli]|uniref:DUF2235 domain-containing protein n=1 Tax=Allopusillimonas soli TaxID=659016 RepID=A0A853FGJ2_9BURK|nr:DUF2235 domain-containing protein [Allopusillimonas soli]NYT37910.1 DUF2235 domain-containing protein [Allopusillimonas soli]TEA73809.1 hypothetical protein ERD78_13595 [Allopusillimonas soli]
MGLFPTRFASSMSRFFHFPVLLSVALALSEAAFATSPQYGHATAATPASTSPHAAQAPRVSEAEQGMLRVAPGWPGWPGLAWHMDHAGRARAWESSLTGVEQLQFDQAGVLRARILANGTASRITFDAQGRPVQVTATGPAKGQTVSVDIEWRGARWTRVAHPREIETRTHDAAGRLATRTIQRPDEAVYAESFKYDALGRLSAHHLPEGGVLIYRWHTSGRLAAIFWRTAAGALHTVIDSHASRRGYRYGNGLVLETRQDGLGRAALLTLRRPSHGEAPSIGTRGAVQYGHATRPVAPAIWIQRLSYDSLGRIRHEHHALPGTRHSDAWQYAYDGLHRMVAAWRMSEPAHAAQVQWFAWHLDGALAARRTAGGTYHPALQRDDAGLPLRADGWKLRYGPAQRLEQAEQAGLIARYTHNAFGHRIGLQATVTASFTDADPDGARQPAGGGPASMANAAGHGLDRRYFYLDNQLVAERDGGAATYPRISRRYIRAGVVPVGMIDYSASGHGRLYWIHADLIGAPRLMTDEHGSVRWLARYDPLGKATVIAGDLSLDLRLPGQVHDPVTGWHDNLLRTYDPAAGHYLEPDPLGPVPGAQALGYAAQQPRRYADPLGLLLFAFDGTRHDLAQQSNVAKMLQAYRGGPAHYEAGSGPPGIISEPAITGALSDRAIGRQWQRLLDALRVAGGSVEHVAIDIIGYSRGAALARHFGNLISRHMRDGIFTYYDAHRRTQFEACMDLRFMGLFDTVTQFGLTGSANNLFDFTIAPHWRRVAHAVALHERRRLFPVLPATGANVNEQPFVGAHSDIGGMAGIGADGAPPRRDDLSKVPLNWMADQAAQVAAIFELEAADRRVRHAAIHGQRSGDRAVEAAPGRTAYRAQDLHPIFGARARAQVEPFITWHTGGPGPSNRNGTEAAHVDMAAYAVWLRQTLGWNPPPGLHGTGEP